MTSCVEPEWVWRYRPTSKAKHLVASVNNSHAVCGLPGAVVADWRGTGSEAEFDLLCILPFCRRCIRKLAEHQ